MANVTRKGYGQVEPNHLSAQYTGQIYAQLPAMKVTTTGSGNDATTTIEPIEVLENGQFLKYNYAAGRASTDGDGEWMLVFNEVKLYDERHQNYKDFAAKAADMTDGKIYPRLLKTNVGDIFTTNTFKSTTGYTVTGSDDTITMTGLEVGEYVKINDTTGWLEKVSTKPGTGIVFQVVPHFTQIEDSTVQYKLPDQQYAVKLQRIQ